MFIVGRVKEKNLIKHTSQFCLDFFEISKNMYFIHTNVRGGKWKCDFMNNNIG